MPLSRKWEQISLWSSEGTSENREGVGIRAFEPSVVPLGLLGKPSFDDFTDFDFRHLAHRHSVKNGDISLTTVIPLD